MQTIGFAFSRVNHISAKSAWSRQESGDIDSVYLDIHRKGA